MFSALRDESSLSGLSPNLLSFVELYLVSLHAVGGHGQSGTAHALARGEPATDAKETGTQGRRQRNCRAYRSSFNEN